MANGALITQRLALTEDVTLGSLGGTGTVATITQEIKNTSVSLTGTSVPAATKFYSAKRTLSGGADTIDLTSLLDSKGAALTFNALKVIAFQFKADSANTQPVVFKFGATNPYNLFGDATGRITLAAGCSSTYYGISSLPAVGAGAKNIDVSSAHATASYEVSMVAG